MFPTCIRKPSPWTLIPPKEMLVQSGLSSAVLPQSIPSLVKQYLLPGSMHDKWVIGGAYGARVQHIMSSWTVDQ